MEIYNICYFDKILIFVYYLNIICRFWVFYYFYKDLFISSNSIIVYMVNLQNYHILKLKDI